MHRLVLSVLLLTATLAPATAVAQDSSKRRFPRVRLGGIMVNAGYTHWSGGGPWWPGYYGFASPYYASMGYGWAGPMGPLWGSPWLWGGGVYPGFWYGYGFSDGRGEIKLNSAPKDAEVYIDGAFAGTAGRLKSMWLDPGIYQLEVGENYRKKVYVLGGKSLRLEVK